eukprot:NODE_44_length_28780_cov_0.148496.p2 type:complete len:1456 gc:universal NODE_44_length_28780_cov_0.148496:6487-2120(-)
MSLLKTHFKERKVAYEGMELSEIVPEYFADTNALCLGVLLSKITSEYIVQNARQLCTPFMRQVLKRKEIDILLTICMDNCGLGIWDELIKMINENNIKLIIKNSSVILDHSENSTAVYKSLLPDHLSKLSGLLTHANQQIRQQAANIFSFASIYCKISKYLNCSESLKTSIIEKCKSAKETLKDLSPDSANEIETEIEIDAAMDVDEPMHVQTSLDPKEKYIESFSNKLNALQLSPISIQPPSEDDLNNPKWNVKFQALTNVSNSLQKYANLDYFDLYVHLNHLKSTFKSAFNSFTFPKLDMLDDELFHTLLPLLNNKNVNVSAAAAQCLYCYLLLSLNPSFALQVLPISLAHLKDKKQSHADLVYICCCLLKWDTVIDNITSSLHHKTPFIQLQAISILHRCIHVRPVYKPLLPLLYVNMDVRDANVRDSTCDLLGLISFICPQKYEFDKLKMAKIEDAIAKYKNDNEIVWYKDLEELFKTGAKPDSVNKQKPAYLTSNKEKKPVLSSVSSKEIPRSRSGIIGAPKPVMKRSLTAAVSNSSSTNSLPVKRKLTQRTPVKQPLVHPNHDIDELVEQHVPSNIQSLFKSSNYKDRVSGIQQFPIVTDFEILIYVILHYFKNEMNFHVNLLILTLFHQSVKQSSIEVVNSVNHLILPYVVNRITDNKCHDLVCLLLCSLQSRSFLSNLSAMLPSIKNVKVHISMIQFLSTLTFDDVEELSDYLQFCATHSNIAIKRATSTLKDAIKNSASNNNKKKTVNVSTDILECIPLLRDTNWKQRQLGLQKLTGLLQQHNSGTNINAIYQVLSVNLQDSNKNLILATIQVIIYLPLNGLVKHKQLLLQLINCYMDTKQSIKDATTKTLTHLLGIMSNQQKLTLLQCLVATKHENSCRCVLLLLIEYYKINSINNEQYSIINEFIIQQQQNKNQLNKKYSMQLKQTIQDSRTLEIAGAESKEVGLPTDLAIPVDEPIQEPATLSLDAENEPADMPLDAQLAAMLSNTPVMVADLIPLLLELSNINYRISNEQMTIVIPLLLESPEFKLLYALTPSSKILEHLILNKTLNGIAEIHDIITRYTCKDVVCKYSKELIDIYSSNNMDLEVINNILPGSASVQQHVKASSKYDTSQFDNKYKQSVIHLISELELLDCTRSYYTCKELQLNISKCNAYSTGIINGIIMNYNKFIPYKCKEQQVIRLGQEMSSLLTIMNDEGMLINYYSVLMPMLLYTLKKIDNEKLQVVMNSLIVKMIYKMDILQGYAIFIQMLINLIKEKDYKTSEVKMMLISKCINKLQRNHNNKNAIEDMMNSHVLHNQNDLIIEELVKLMTVMGEYGMDYKNNSKSEIPLRIVKTVLVSMQQNGPLIISGDDKYKVFMREYLTKDHTPPELNTSVTVSKETIKIPSFAMSPVENHFTSRLSVLQSKLNNLQQQEVEEHETSGSKDDMQVDLQDLSSRLERLKQVQ